MAKLLLSALLICISAIWVVAAADVPAGRRGCQTRCGNLDIPFPFGIGDQCAIHGGFGLDCKNDSGTYRTFIGPFEVTKISVPDAKAWMKMGISWQCYDPVTKQMNDSMVGQNFTNTPYRFSYEDNKIFVIGCNTMAYMRGVSYVIGCLSTCSDEPTNGSCSGAGCCSVDVPPDLGYVEAYFNKDYNTSQIWNYSRCGYLVVMEKAAFRYSTTYIPSINFWNDYNGTVPAVMDWVIRRETCEEAKRDMSSYACVSDNSDCHNSTNGHGYLCKCSKGFDGNPYIKDGCKDINECLDNTTYPCAGLCQNTMGGYDCSCHQGQHKVEDVCVPDQKNQKSSWEMPVVGMYV
ncbi:Os09g0471550 [Oryza sativa Japonica Group]|uniref:Os09g0471550 protein n=1 Tax=Oryza sativa subsp. japonica TaxID=39947 RepID=A0A0N7KQZ1_ORYSJ|nr:hypothetical protein EE612_048451 [Oryza sativa]BAT08562.1 Os09g0471550 [Oryza sativa Japonica Group]